MIFLMSLDTQDMSALRSTRTREWSADTQEMTVEAWEKSADIREMTRDTREISISPLFARVEMQRQDHSRDTS